MTAMFRPGSRTRGALLAGVIAAVSVGGAFPAAPAAPVGAQAAPAALVEGPLPGTVPGDRLAPDIEDTYPWFSTTVDLAGAGYVEQEFILSGNADAYSATGALLAEDVPYRTRIIVRRPQRNVQFNGNVLVEWQNVTAGYDLDALWSPQQIIDRGYAWVGVSAQRVGVSQLAGWSPARYGSLDVTGGGRFTADEMSYDIFSQAARALRAPEGVSPLGNLRVNNLLAVGASQSAGRMAIYYQSVLPQISPVFDGYGFVVGAAPTRVGPEPVFQILSETDVRSPVRPPDTDHFRRWEVAGAAHSGFHGNAYRAPLVARDLGAAPPVTCDQPPLSHIPLQDVLGAAYDHLVRWIEDGTPPPTAEPWRSTRTARSPVTRWGSPRAASACPRSRFRRRSTPARTAAPASAACSAPTSRSTPPPWTRCTRATTPTPTWSRLPASPTWPPGTSARRTSTATAWRPTAPTSAADPAQALMATAPANKAS